MRSADATKSIFIHRMIIVLHMYVLIACFSFVNVHMTHAQSSNVRQLKLSIEKTVIAYPFLGMKSLNVLLSNESKTTATIMVAVDYRQSMRVSMFDKTEIPLSLAKNIKENQNLDTVYNTITIEPESTYTFVINIEDYVVIPRPGVYKIQVRYYPHLHIDDDKTFIASRAILIPITNFTKNQALILPSETAEHRSAQKMQKYSPDDIVTKMLHALQKSDWDMYFTLVDLRSLYINTVNSDDEFGTFSTAQQNEELANFKKRIINNSKNIADISSPDYFSVEKTSYTSNNAEVTTLIYNAYDESTAIKQFVFYLKRIHKIWKVVDYNARLISIISKKDFEKNILRKTQSENDIVQKSDYHYPARETSAQ